MYKYDDEMYTDEAKMVAFNLRKTTINLVRHFMEPSMQLKLKSLFDSRNNEYAGLIDSFEQLKNLTWTKLTMPLEEYQ